MSKLLQDNPRIVLTEEQPAAVQPLYDWLKAVNKDKPVGQRAAIIGLPIWYNSGLVEVRFRPISADAAAKIVEILAADFPKDVRTKRCKQSWKDG